LPSVDILNKARNYTKKNGSEFQNWESLTWMARNESQAHD